MRGKEIAIVYDWIDKWGGAERVLEALYDIFPDSDFYTSYVNSNRAGLVKIDFRTSFIQKLPNIIKNNRVLSIPFYPLAFESFDFTKYKTVISVTSSFAKGIITKPDTKHISYILTPTRFLWSHYTQYSINFPFYNLMAQSLRRWDYLAAQRPDKIISISSCVQDRVKKYYHRESHIIYPPFDVEYWKKLKQQHCDQKKIIQGDFFLVVSRLEKYKNIDLVIQTFNTMPNRKLVILGQGSQKNKLKKIIKSKNIKLISSKVSDKELSCLYKHATALIMPQEEDFGYTALESLFFESPVIFFNKGGVKEIVKDNITGVSFSEQTVKSLKEGIEKYKRLSYNLRTNIKREYNIFDKFSKKNFKNQIQKNI